MVQSTYRMIEMYKFECRLPPSFLHSFIYILQCYMRIDGLRTITSNQEEVQKEANHHKSIANIRTAYQEWLNKLYICTSSKLPAARRRKKSIESAQVDEILRLRRQPSKKTSTKKILKHAMAPTSSSRNRDVRDRRAPSDKDVEIYLTVTDSMRAIHQQATNRRLQALVDEADCATYTYESPLFPATRFFQAIVDHLLSSNSRNAEPSSFDVEIPSFGVDIPPTLIRLQKNDGVAFVRSTNHTDSLAITLFKRREDMDIQRDDILQSLCGHNAPNRLAVVRNVGLSNRKRLRMLRSLEEVKASMIMLWDSESEDNPVMIQKFIACKGRKHFQQDVTDHSKQSIQKSSENDWFARPVYRFKEGSTIVWIIRNSSSAMNASVESSACQIVKCTARNAWLEPRHIVETVAHRLEDLLALDFATLSMDLIQDSEGKWWFLQVQAFQLQLERSTKQSLTRTNSAPERFSPSLCRCDGRFCQEPASDEEDSVLDDSFISRPLLRKELISCHFFQDYSTLHPDNDTHEFSAALEWFWRTKVSKKDRCRLYEAVLLCKNCMVKYLSLQQQLASVLDRVGQPLHKSRSQAHHDSQNRSNRRRNERPTVLPRLSSSHSTACHIESPDAGKLSDEDIVYPQSRAEIDVLVKKADEIYMGIGSRLQTLTLGLPPSWPNDTQMAGMRKKQTGPSLSLKPLPNTTQRKSGSDM
uniref:Uncharacterized protein AlNc14C10G1274 n=1 Tax=Albugo laibachii Nc14 TaxID=890382 RepID=F0W2M7_9STRA|nr:hypothetical protein PITG_11163 [Albugo laibachii Nc14]|eukprot:CCA15313.1 hypothetical protein PITG_11163 [Albugo laibachii Nc14]